MDGKNEHGACDLASADVDLQFSFSLEYTAMGARSLRPDPEFTIKITAVNYDNELFNQG
jgi:hypothetical protein